MIKRIYANAIGVLKRSFGPLLGLFWLCTLLQTVGTVFFGVIPGVAVAISWLLGSALALAFLRAYRGEETCCI